jgi:hypothetical protein
VCVSDALIDLGEPRDVPRDMPELVMSDSDSDSSCGPTIDERRPCTSDIFFVIPRTLHDAYEAAFSSLAGLPEVDENFASVTDFDQSDDASFRDVSFREL